MAERTEESRRLQWSHKPPTLQRSNGRGGPPRPPGRTQGNGPSHEPPSLTETFNQAAGHPVSTGAGKAKPARPLSMKEIEELIRLLKKRQSAPTPTLSPSSMGDIPNTINSKRDRVLDKEMKNLQKELQKLQKIAGQMLTREFQKSAERRM